MKLKRLVADHGGKRFVIEEDNPEIGFYIYVYENGKCERDYLQDTLEKAKEFAYEDFSVPLNGWREE